MLERLQLLLIRVFLIALVKFKEQSEDSLQSNQLATIGRLLSLAMSSVKSITILSGELNIAIKDSVAIARSYFETTLNASLVGTDGGELAERARLHLIYKFWSSNNREATLGDQTIRIKGPYRIDENDSDILNARRLFDRKGKRVLDGWSGMTVNQRIDVIGKSSSMAKTYFFGAKTLIYGDSSEILHGSLYGAMISFQSIGNANEENAQKLHLESLSSLVTTTILVSSAGLACTLRQILGLNSLADRIESLLHELADVD